MTGVSEIIDVPDEVMPTMGPVIVEVHVNVVPGRLAVGVKFMAVPLHSVVAREVFVMTGTGFTVTLIES
jgi:hypothetical protein